MEQLSLNFDVSTTQRHRKAVKFADQEEQPTLFASWTPNIDIHLHSPTEAVAQITGPEPERAHHWLAGVTGEVTSVKTRRAIFPTYRLDRLLAVRPPAQVTLDAAATAVGKALWAHKLGLRPLRVTRSGQRLLAHSPRWPAGMRIKDAPWTTIATLTQLDVPLEVADEARVLFNRRLLDAGATVVRASLAGSAVLLETSRPAILENMGLPGLAYAGSPGDGVYKLPLLNAKPLLRQPLIEVPEALAATIEKACRPTKPVQSRQLGPDFPWTLYDFQAVDAGAANHILDVTGGALLAGDMGSGKAIPWDTDLETPQGLRTAEEIQVGDFLFGRDGKPTRVLGVFPQGRREIYAVSFSDGVCVETDGSHLWTARTGSGAWGEVTTREIADGLEKGWRIPVTEPVQFGEHDFLEDECHKLGMKLREYQQWPGTRTRLVEYVKRGSVAQRVALLKGLFGAGFDTALPREMTGTVPAGQCRELTQWLVGSLGGLVYQECEGAAVRAVFTERERRVVEVKFARTTDAICFQVAAPDSLFLTESFVVTHNTTVSLALAQLRNTWPLLVVAPLAAFSTWERQLEEMGKSMYLATDSPRVTWKTIESGEHEAIVISYDRLGAFAELIERMHFKAMIADEIQRIRTPGARRSRAIRAMAASMPLRIGLSGTPVTNSLADILAVGSVLAPGEWRPRATSRDLADMYPGDPTEAIAEHLGSMMVRRRIDEVGRKMPKRNDHRIYVQMTPEQRRAVADLEAEARAAKEAGEFGGPDGKFNALARLTRMRKIIANPRSAGIPGPNPKVNQAVKLIKQLHAEGRKGVVFTVDRASFSDLGEELDKVGIRWGGIWGATPPLERIAVEKRLHAGELDVVICTVAAGAESWTASPTATYCMFLSYVWAPAPLEQAEARVYRLNSDVDGPEIEIIYLHAKGIGGTKLGGESGEDAPEGSLDDRMVEVLEMKKQLFAQVVDRRQFVDSTKTHATLSDLLFVLTGERDETMVLAEKDAQDVVRREADAKKHARETLYARKGRNKSDVSLGKDDGSVTQTYEEYVDVSALVEDLDYAEDDDLDAMEFEDFIDA